MHACSPVKVAAGSALARLLERGPAGFKLDKLKRQFQRRQHLRRGRHNFQTDAVARQQRDPIGGPKLAHVRTLQRAKRPKPTITAPAMTLTQRSHALLMRVLSNAVTPLSSDHQSAEPRKTPATSHVAPA